MSSEASYPHNDSAADIPLVSTMDHVIEQCSRFRVLVVGKACPVTTGAGKSSLINAIFKCHDARVSEIRPGESNIEQEITSQHNPRFVLHDSNGYEPGETKHIDILQTFIEKRSIAADENQRLHAIWLCISIPLAGGRVLERGDEKLFKIKRNNVPIIIVFTKYDELIRKFEFAIQKTRDTMNNAELSKLQEDAKHMYQESCIEPLKAGLKHVPPIVNVSVSPGYEDTLPMLVEVTLEQMRSGVRVSSNKITKIVGRILSRPSHGHDESEQELHYPELMLATAQGVDLESKISASIDVGRKKYWRELWYGTVFNGKTMLVCLDTLHKDIVLVWNFSNAQKRFFREDVMKVAGPAAEFIPHATAIGLSVAAAIFLANFLYGVYKSTHPTVSCLMAYIVDLTIVMRRLFQLSRAAKSSTLNPESVDEVLKEFDASAEKIEVHDAIREFVAQASFLQTQKKDFVFEKVVSLIREHTTESAGGGATGSG
ncbi:hypothetical protein B0H21DRAFT_710250 [Amylocystis lapponica]|nr:hypothetical protein B0H21DRAFT_710250 [Amylocystis lapponica]